jgi:hypothetical protein
MVFPYSEIARNGNIEKKYTLRSNANYFLQNVTLKSDELRYKITFVEQL